VFQGLGLAENLTVAIGEQEDRRMPHDIATHLGADTRQDGDKASFAANT
jgi:hypothetical protein